MRSCILSLVIFGTVAATNCPGQLINSWEGSLEGWMPEPTGFSLSSTAGGPNAGVGVTDGVDSLQVFRFPRKAFNVGGGGI